MGSGISMPEGVTLSEDTTKALEGLPDAAKEELKKKLEEKMAPPAPASG